MRIQVKLQQQTVNIHVLNYVSKWNQEISTGMHHDAQQRKRANNRARYKANKIIKQYPEYGFRIEKDYPDGIHSLTLWVFMSDEMERKATEMQHHLMDSHWADDWIDVSERLDEMVAFCKEHHQA